MSDVLAKIIDGKSEEVALLKAQTSQSALQSEAAAASPVRDGVVHGRRGRGGGRLNDARPQRHARVGVMRSCCTDGVT